MCVWLHFNIPRIIFKIQNNLNNNNNKKKKLKVY